MLGDIPRFKRGVKIEAHWRVSLLETPPGEQGLARGAKFPDQT